jgi:hypothetical protein
MQNNPAIFSLRKNGEDDNRYYPAHGAAMYIRVQSAEQKQQEKTN